MKTEMKKIEKLDNLEKISKKDPISHVTDSDVRSILSEKELVHFYEFMNGQGSPLVNGKLCYFPWDVSRFIRNYIK